MDGTLEPEEGPPYGLTPEGMALAEERQHSQELETDLFGLCRLLKEYLALTSTDGKPERQVLRAELTRFLKERNL